MSIHTIDFTTSVNMVEITDRIDELRSEREDLQSTLGDASDDNESDFAWAALEQWTGDEGQELEALEAIAEELEGMGGDHLWEGNWYPINLIHENNFESEMDEMMADCYPELSDKLPSWVSLTLDYDALKQDYTEHDFDGNTFYVR